MTREEAINVIKANYPLGGYWRLREALEMAIKALEQESVLDRIKDELIDRYPRNYANELELGGRSCVFSLNEILRIIDKHKAESKEGAEE